MKRNFTLIELLIVIAILATVAGGLIAAYDGLGRQASKGQATYNIAALDKAIRTFAAVNKVHPDNFDSLLVDNGGGTDVLNAVPTKLQGKLGAHSLTAEGAAALNAIGVNNARFITVGSFNNAPLGTAGATESSIPNRLFDNPTRGFGSSAPLAAGTTVAAVENIGQADFGGATPADSSRLRDIAGLDETVAHVVVAFGIGNNSTLVKTPGNGATNAALSEAPFYTDILPNEYGRFIALYHLGSDSDASGAVDAAEYFTRARFVGVLDTKGDWYDEELAEFTGQKQ